MNIRQQLDSLISQGVIISGGTVRESILFRRVRVNSYSLVERSVLFADGPLILASALPDPHPRWLRDNALRLLGEHG